MFGSISYVDSNGVLRTEEVKSVQYSSGSPAVYRRLNRWQRAMRALTPRRWRSSLLVRPAEPAGFVINRPESDPAGKTVRMLDEMQSAFDRLCTPDEK